MNCLKLKKSLLLMTAVTLILTSTVTVLAESESNTAAEDKSLSVIVFSPMPEEETVQQITSNTSWPELSASLPDSLSASVSASRTDLDSAQTIMNMLVPGITWECPDYQTGLADGTVLTATAVLPDGYAPAPGVALPQIELHVIPEIGMMSLSSPYADERLTFYVWTLLDGKSIQDKKIQPGLRDLGDTSDGMPNQDHEMVNIFGAAALSLKRSNINQYQYFNYEDGSKYHIPSDNTVLTADKTILKINLALAGQGTTTITLLVPGDPDYPENPLNPEDKSVPDQRMIHGKVTNQLGVGIEGVTVTAKSTAPDSGHRRSVLTDASGNYSIALSAQFFSTPNISAAKNGYIITPGEGYTTSFYNWDISKSYDFSGTGQNMPKLTAPTGLAWESGNPSIIAKWNAVDNAGKYSISLYRDGIPTPLKTFQNISALSYDCTAAIKKLGSGRYTFAVIAISADASFDNSPLSAQSSAYEFVAAPDPDPNPDPNPGSGSSTGLPSSNNGSNHSNERKINPQDSSGGKTTVLKTANAKSLTENAAKTGGYVKVKNVKSVKKSFMTAMSKTNASVKLAVDSFDGTRHIGSIYIDPTKAVKDIRTGMTADSRECKRIQGSFENQSNKDVTVIEMGQKGSFGMEVEVAIKVDAKKYPDKVYVYAYNAKTKSYRNITTSKTVVDKNGFLKLAISEGDYLVITTTPPAAK